MKLSTLLLFFSMVLPVVPQGFKCTNANYRLFAVHNGPITLWQGSYKDAAAICKKVGHVLAKNVGCLQQISEKSANVTSLVPGSLPETFWVDGADKGCVSFSTTKKNSSTADCNNALPALCQGLSADDHVLTEAYKTGTFPYVQIFGSPSSSGNSMPSVDAYYVLCGILGIILISIVVAAAIWRSGYINNRYSFHRMRAAEAAAAAPKKAAPKSQTVTSQMDSEVPHGYVKASVTKETIA